MKQYFRTSFLVTIGIALLGCNVNSNKSPVFTKTITTTVTTTTIITTNLSSQSAPNTTYTLLNPIYLITQQPETQCSQSGTFTAFSVRVSPETNVVYQWRFGDVDILNATNREFFIQPVGIANVGKYTVQVTWPGASTSVISSNAFLSVYTLWGTNSTGGALTTSAQQFTYATTPIYYCTAGGATCNSVYNPLDAVSGVYYFFYGPGVPLNLQTGPFINYGHNRNLTVTTATSENADSAGSIITSGVKLITGWTPTTQIDCQIGYDGGGFTVNNLATSTNPDVAKYRPTIFFLSPAPPSGNITLKWQYHDTAGDY